MSNINPRLDRILSACLPFLTVQYGLLHLCRPVVKKRATSKMTIPRSVILLA